MGEHPMTLYVFPHAGGSAQYYLPFAKTFSPAVRCVAVQYPGSGGSHDLGAFTGIPDLADKVSGMISPREVAAGHAAFFGHSMGALLAFEVACRLEAAGSLIAALFVSACAAPGRIGYDDIPESDRGLLDAVSEMTGASPEFLEDAEFAAKILPTLRGFKAIINYRCAPDARVSCPIYAFLGDNDDIATPEKVQPWSERTTSEFSKHMFTGHHFYLSDHLPELAGQIEARMTASGRR